MPLVNPKVVTTSTCSAGSIAKEPYLSDCRWKTQNVHVHDNTLAMDRSPFFGCPATLCGRNAVFSDYGSYPDWSPYQGDGGNSRADAHPRFHFSGHRNH